MTYSIIARDPVEGHLGVATQSQAFAVGGSVSWALPGVGAIATQSMGEPMYGELGLHGLSAGLTAEEALAALRTVDPHPERRQVAMVDAAGEVAVYTGAACVEAAGHVRGEGCAALANLVRSPEVWETMLTTYQSASGWLPGRLVDALEAAEDAGGDLRGRRSAAVLVVRARRSGRPWHDQVVDLRVDDHPEPVRELRRLVVHTWRYQRTVEAFELALDGAADAAVQALPDHDPDPGRDPDLALWRAVVLAAADRDAEAAALGRGLQRQAPAFVQSARRFVPAGLIDDTLLRRVLPDG